MTVAFDALSDTGSFTTTSPDTSTHTPVGTPRGVILGIAHGTESADLITGATYGGVTMTRIITATDTVDEPGRVYFYFVGAGIPTGAQTVSITHTANATVKRGFTCTVTAANDTEVMVTGSIGANQANPQIALDAGARSALRFCTIYSGVGAPATLVLVGSMTAVGQFDFGAFVMKVDRETTASTGSFTVGYTAGTDDVAMVGAGIAERLSLVIPRNPGLAHMLNR